MGRGSICFLNMHGQIHGLPFRISFIACFPGNGRRLIG